MLDELNRITHMRVSKIEAEMFKRAVDDPEVLKLYAPIPADWEVIHKFSTPLASGGTIHETLD